VLCHDAVDVLQRRVVDASIDELLLYFPDPWPKKRHHKRRIVQLEFVELVARKLKPGGAFRMATDWEHYAQHMLATASACALLHNESTSGDYVERPKPARSRGSSSAASGWGMGYGTWRSGRSDE
jgi:tRNA (guanine-N7-)-methyltransferase